MAQRTISFGEHPAVPVIGQGTWYMGENPALRVQESAALRAGIELGLTVIDTAEMYADGGAEEVVGEAIRGQRLRSQPAPPEDRLSRSLPSALARRLRIAGDGGRYGSARCAGQNSSLGRIES